jgi:hypothetical protein
MASGHGAYCASGKLKEIVDSFETVVTATVFAVRNGTTEGVCIDSLRDYVAFDLKDRA